MVGNGTFWHLRCLRQSVARCLGMCVHLYDRWFQIVPFCDKTLLVFPVTRNRLTWHVAITDRFACALWTIEYGTPAAVHASHHDIIDSCARLYASLPWHGYQIMDWWLTINDYSGQWPVTCPFWTTCFFERELTWVCRNCEMRFMIVASLEMSDEPFFLVGK